MRTVVLLNAIDGVGHYSPLVSIAAALLEREDEKVVVRFLARHRHFGLLTKLFSACGTNAERAGEVLVGIDDDRDNDLAVKLAEARGGNMPLPVLELNDTREAIIATAISQLGLRESDVVVGVADMFSLGAARAFKAIGAPFATVIPGPAALLSVLGPLSATNFDDLRERLRLRLTPSLRLKTYELRAVMAEMVQDCDMCLVSSFDESLVTTACLPPLARLPEKVHLVRTFGWNNATVLGDNLSRKTAEFLAGALPVVIVTGSTVDEMSPTPTGLRAIYDGLTLGKEKWRVVWRICNPNVFSATKIPKDEGQDWITFVDWLPQSALLAHPNVKCVCTHLGWNSTTEALASGTPMLGVPIAADQPMNASLVGRLGCGIALDSADKTIPAFGMPSDPLTRPPEEFSARQVHSHFDAILKPNSKFAKKAADARDIFFPANGSSRPDFGPKHVAALILDRLARPQTTIAHAKG